MTRIEATQTTQLQILFLKIVFLTVASAIVLAILDSSFSHQPLVDSTILVPRYRAGLSPKPVERFVFLVLAFFVPILAFYLNARTQFARQKYIPKWLYFAAPALLSAALFIPFVGFDFSQALISGKSMPPEHPIRLMGFCVATALVWIGWIGVSRRRRTRKCPVTTSIASIMFILVMLLQIFSFRLAGESSITLDSGWWDSADAAIYALSQAVAGKTVLADFPSQYGLFPEILAPVFRIAGFSILKFTAACAVLQVISLSSIFFVTQRFIREPALKITFGLAVVMITFETSLWVIGFYEPYFQYWPMRFFWPALSVMVFYLYAARGGMGSLAAVSVIGAIGTVWNIDSGIMIEISLGAFILGKWLSMYVHKRDTTLRERQFMMLALIVHISVFLIIVFSFAVYLSIKADHSLHGSWLFEYQHLFYGTGFMMIPLPLRPSPWMPVVAVYLLGMIIATFSWQKKQKSKFADFLFFISFLGLGLFVYYEGRSHILNLITVAWPALMICVILADRSIRLVRAGVLPRVQLLPPAVALALLLFCCIPILRNINVMWEHSRDNYLTRNQASSPLVASELSFIRAHSTRGDACLILARRQGLYYAATGLVSPIDGPGYIETITMSDRDALIRRVNSRRLSCVFVGIGKDSAVELDFDPVSLFDKYDVRAKSTSGTMLYIVPHDS